MELGTLEIGVKAGHQPPQVLAQRLGETDVILDFGGVTFRPGKTLLGGRGRILVER
ncbi:hypothetical protein QJS66_16625 [Kocuria rhizophila]|nr:hypothetical protein QJS66_16625 [Kocuria rhizophila]